MSKHCRWQHEQEVAAALAALRQHVATFQEAELARTLTQLDHLDEQDREVVRQLGQQLVEQLLAHLVSRVRHLSDQEPSAAVLDLLRQLFAVSLPAANTSSRMPLLRSQQRRGRSSAGANREERTAPS